MQDKKLYYVLIITGVIISFSPVFVIPDQFVSEIAPKVTRMDVTDHNLLSGKTLTFSAYLTEHQNAKLILTGSHIQPDIHIINPLGFEEPYEIVQSKPESSDSDLLYSFDASFSPTIEGDYKVTITGQEEGTTINHGFFGSELKPRPVQNIALNLMLFVGSAWIVFSLLIIGIVKLSRKIENNLHISQKTKKELLSKDSLQNEKKTWAVRLSLIFGIFQIHGIGHFYLKKYLSGSLFLAVGFLSVVFYHYSYIQHLALFDYIGKPPGIFSIHSHIQYLTYGGSYFAMLFLTIYVMQILHICYFTKSQKIFFRVTSIIVIILIVGIIFTVYPGYWYVNYFLQEITPEITLANHNDTVIKLKNYSGECIGYCSVSVIMTSEKISYSRSGHDYAFGKVYKLPEITNEIPMSKIEWQKILDLVNFTQFLLLPDRIGSPGATDAPVKTIEISMNGLTKSISFEDRDNISAISDLRTKLEEISKTAIPMINSFEECADAGYEIGTTYPWQCVTDNGQIFVKTSIHSFEECADAGYEIVQTDPRQCIVNKYRHFIEP